MPLYEYECETENGRRFEIIAKFSDPVLTICPTCGGPVRRLISSPAIQFKGSGFYITDYARKSGTDAGKESKGSPTSGSTEASSNASSSSTTPATPAAGSTPSKKD